MEGTVLTIEGKDYILREHVPFTHKKCYRCKKEVSLDLFCKNARRKDGYGTSCRSCSRKTSNELYRKKREKQMLESAKQPHGEVLDVFTRLVST